MSAPRLRAAFVGAAAVRALSAMRGPLIKTQRWAFHATQPRPLASGEWARGVDVLVLGTDAAQGAVPRQAMSHAATAGVHRVVILADSDQGELAHREICSDFGLDGDEAIVVRVDQANGGIAAAVENALDHIAIAPPPQLVMSGVVVVAREREDLVRRDLVRGEHAQEGQGSLWHVELRGTVLRGALQSGDAAWVLAGGAWLACTFGRVALAGERGFFGGHKRVDVARAGDVVALGVSTSESARALRAPANASNVLIETLVVDVPLPLVDTLAIDDAIEPVEVSDGRWAEPRVFLGWTSARAKLDVNARLLRLERAQPAPPTGRWFALPT